MAQESPQLEPQRLREIVLKVYNSQEYRDRRKKFDRYDKEYSGEWWNESNLKSSDSKAFANFVFSTIQTTAPLLTDNRPIWRTVSRLPYLQFMAELYNKTLEFLWNILELDKKTYDLVKDALLYGTGILKVYFDPESDDIAVDVVDPRDFVMAPGYEDPWEAPWCGIRRKMPLSWLRMHYPDQADDVTSESLDSGREEQADTNASDIELEQQMVWVNEIWMRDSSVESYYEDEGADEGETKKRRKQWRQKYPNGRIVIFTDEDIVLEDKPSPFDHGKPPYVHMVDYDVNHQFWGMGEPDQIEDLTREFNVRMQQLFEHIRKNTKVNYVKAQGVKISKKSWERAMAEGDHLFETENDYVDPTKQVAPISGPEPHRAHFEVMNLIPQLIEEITGVTDMSKGQSGKAARQSAREIAVLIESSYTRTRQRVRNYEYMIKRLATLILELMQQFYVEPRQFHVVEDDGIRYGEVSNSKNVILDQMEQMLPGSDVEQQDLSPEDKQFYDDYMRMAEVFSNSDHIYAQMDVVIDTNSSLPMDRQNLVQMALRFKEMGILDSEAVLEITRFPGKDRIIKRLKDMQKKKAQQEMGQKRQPQGARQSPPRDLEAKAAAQKLGSQ